MSRALDVVTLTGEEYDDLMECKEMVASLLALAAIREYLGGYSRETAESLALQEWVKDQHAIR